jgi:hypothetical protein
MVSNPETTEKWYGFYSRTMALSEGPIYYLTPEGREVAVTCVTKNRDGRDYYHLDKIYVGEVTKCIRSERTSSLEMRFERTNL